MKIMIFGWLLMELSLTTSNIHTLHFQTAIFFFEENSFPTLSDPVFLGVTLPVTDVYVMRTLNTILLIRHLFSSIQLSCPSFSIISFLFSHICLLQNVNGATQKKKKSTNKRKTTENAGKLRKWKQQKWKVSNRIEGNRHVKDQQQNCNFGKNHKNPATTQ